MYLHSHKTTTPKSSNTGMQTTRVYKVRGNLGFLTSLSQSNKKPKHLPVEVKFGSGVDGVVVGVVGLRA